MWIVCYINEKNQNEWRTAHDDGDLFDLLKDIQYFDAEGNVQWEDLYIFREGQSYGSEELYEKLKSEAEANTWESR